MKRLVVFALAFGLAAALEVSFEDTPAVETPGDIRAEGFIAVEGDFHVHTRFSDGAASPFDLVLMAERRGLQTIAITEHNATFPAKLARWFGDLTGSPVVVVIGEEVTSREAHLLALGIERTVDPRESIEEVADDVRSQGGVLLAAHPVRRFWDGLEGSCESLDGVERMHPLAFRKQTAFGTWDDVRSFQETCEERTGRPMAVVGNSDFHVGPDLGAPRTLLFVRELTQAGVIESIREHRTVVRDPDGSWHGQRDWVARAERIEMRSEQPTRGPLQLVLGFATVTLFSLGLFARGPARGITRAPTAHPE